jgi:hypothetical protein
MIDLYVELKAVLHALETADVPYALCGGLALMVYQRPRATVDIDLILPAPEADRRLREVAQLRKLWRGFREPQERLEDERLSRPLVRDRPFLPRVQEPLAAYGRPAIRAAIRHWWCAGEYATIVELGERLDPAWSDEEPLIRVYIEAAKAHLAQVPPQ